MTEQLDSEGCHVLQEPFNGQWLLHVTADSLHCQVAPSSISGHSLGRDWRRRPGCPRARWTDQLHNDTGLEILWFPPISGDKLYCEAVVEGRNGPTWLRDDDVDEYDKTKGTRLIVKTLRRSTVIDEK